MKDEKIERTMIKEINNFTEFGISLDTKEVRDIIINICYGIYVLPEIQREFVWKTHKEIQFITDLFFNFNNVQICGGDKVIVLKPKGREYYYLMDGQQRLSSILDFLYSSKLNISNIIPKNLKELMETCKSKTNRDKILNLSPDELGLTLKTTNIELKNEEIRKYLNGKKATDLSEELILALLKRTFRIEIITVPDNVELIKRIQKMFLDINNRVNITEGEKIKAQYYYTKYYKNRYDLAVKFSKYIKIRDNSFTKLISALIDIDKAREGKYGASFTERKKYIERKNQEVDYISETEELNLKIMGILLDIFEDKSVLTEFNYKTNLWNKYTNIAVIVPWFLAIEELLLQEIDEKVFGEKREKILEEWRNVTNKSKLKNNTLTQKWIEGKTDHSANKEKIIDRKEVIIDLLKMSIS
ncbi:DUF262 domain-containing protein [Clostridium beijerinckii]|uniref:DUF262 domain-containing protein n=1 Tax=Clostridium beijerinckii TaxID=1520 RepID=A0AAW3W7A4_CLOBE|nr:DUF262 domain-containing protein [Clostridium beijerinckii]MBC2457297.1 DUF262 domain-containing protein [Clostridium beijerinckii]MBC2474353.1 DUF262 domain-containing protein [Clostridium beijerinckii]NOV59012.1 hypothetical protein [Clostridium beijerinckii]NOV71600.1 hypothetical protein [Clostridium beijerinckii]NOW32367.1 hypothetical protein [Clostridium beijerinckii]